MGVICFASLKGGVGKTSAAVNTAHAFATAGCETVLVDLDPSCNASLFFRAGPFAAPQIEQQLAHVLLSSRTHEAAA